MKKMILIMLSLFMVLCLAPSVSADFGRSYTARYGSPDIDGEIEELWEVVAWTEVDKPYDGTNESDSTMKMKFLWDESNLYFLSEIVDKSLNAENDCVEIYLDQKHDKQSSYGSDDSQTRFKVAGGIVTGELAGTNAQTDCNFEVVTMKNDTYVMEGAFYWTNITPEVGKTMGIEMMYNDGNAETDFVEAYRWNADTANGDPAPYMNTTAFGTLIFADEEGNVPEESTVETSTEEETTTEPETTPAPESSSEEETTTVPESSSEAETTTDSDSSVADSMLPADTSDSVSEKDDGDKDGLSVGAIIGIVAAVAVAAAVVVILIVKKKK